MAHYAILNEDNIVTFVHPGKDEGEDGVNWEDYYGAVRTSYNTHGGQHANGGTPFRFNFASIGYIFDPDFGLEGAFIPPQPFASWTLNSSTALWDAPTPVPNTREPWSWSESGQQWILEPPRPSQSHIWDQETLSWIEAA